MTESDYILLMTSAILRSSQDQQMSIQSKLKQSYNTDTPFEPGAVSLGGMKGDEHLNFTDWVIWLKGLQINSIDCFYIPVSSAVLPAHKAAAFAGNVEFLLRISASTEVLYFALLTLVSPPHLLEASSFIEVVNAQPLAEKRWLRVRELINQSNQLNGLPELPDSHTSDYLLSEEGRKIYDSMAGSLLEEIQIDAAVDKLAFVIPSTWQEAFYKPESVFYSPEKDFISLYPLKAVTAYDLIALMNAQPDQPSILKLVEAEVEIDFPGYVSSADKQYLLSFLETLSQDQLEQVSYVICQAIAGYCTNKELFPVIPDSLATVFGPDELNQRRAILRGKLSDRWMLNRATKHWRHLCFSPIQITTELELANPALAEQELKSALQLIAVFAQKIDSPFYDVFRLAQFILSDAFTPGEASQEELEKWKGQLQQLSFSDTALSVFEKHFYIVDFLSFGWPLSGIRGLMATSVANVFGGMGSWNDQYLNEQQEEFEFVSASFFNARRQYFAAQLSGLT